MSSISEKVDKLESCNKCFPLKHLLPDVPFWSNAQETFRWKFSQGRKGHRWTGQFTTAVVLGLVEKKKTRPGEEYKYRLTPDGFLAIGEIDRRNRLNFIINDLRTHANNDLLNEKGLAKLAEAGAQLKTGRP